MPQGGEVPLQTETLARWPDGSVRWLLLDFQIDLAAKQKKTLTLRYGPEVRRAAVAKPVRVTKQADGKVIDRARAGAAGVRSEEVLAAGRRRG